MEGDIESKKIYDWNINNSNFCTHIFINWNSDKNNKKRRSRRGKLVKCISNLEGLRGNIYAKNATDLYQEKDHYAP